MGSLFVERRRAKDLDVTPDHLHPPNTAVPPATYSQAVKAAGLAFVSGTTPIDPATGAIVGRSIQKQPTNA